jgi:prolyl 4-hydroxylase
MQNDKRNYIGNDYKLEIFTITDFLTNDECNSISDLIKQNHYQSLVAGTKSENYSNARTSSTSNLFEDNNIISQINQKIYNELNITKEFAEPTQGQLYEIGQEYKYHNDYFWGSDVDKYCNVSGQRTYTCMIYLNDNFEGGETDFWYLGIKIKPKTGKAVFWKNSEGLGNENIGSLHAGSPVVSGEKMIITKWFREKQYVI